MPPVQRSDADVKVAQIIKLNPYHTPEHRDDIKKLLRILRNNASFLDEPTLRELVEKAHDLPSTDTFEMEMNNSIRASLLKRAKDSVISLVDSLQVAIVALVEIEHQTDVARRSMDTLSGAVQVYMDALKT
jgi:hypothetical protein